ncbi:hypothetical protein CWB58_10080 [Pseudoalteromonas sp. S201]|nr:hypothetical protein CWC10_05910 [Pseudoalteromonas sp. S3173]TMS93197.1 hypothetical protein CWB58_10080 [Pseudoalteromonas sp. S201]|tara:strand:- start:1082 stop:1540 length:459 start_codon:yes stop_codon:yes gene_type:complete
MFMESYSLILFCICIIFYGLQIFITHQKQKNEFRQYQLDQEEKELHLTRLNELEIELRTLIDKLAQSEGSILLLREECNFKIIYRASNKILLDFQYDLSQNEFLIISIFLKNYRYYQDRFVTKAWLLDKMREIILDRYSGTRRCPLGEYIEN